jgi:myo-inositol-1(or 4)-monophosphatase
MEKRLHVAIEAARAAAAIQRKHFGADPAVDRKATHDIKLEVDRRSEEAIRTILLDAFPDDAVLAEEGGASAGTSGLRWIVDPLDGTVNYFYGIPYYAVSIACYGEGEAGDGANAFGRPLLGVVHAPATDELFCGIAGIGVWRNDHPLPPARRMDRLSEALVVIGFGSTDEAIRHQDRVRAALMHRVRKVRVLGAAAYDVANVAAGRVSVFYEPALRTWDLAAGALLAEETGVRLRVRPVGEERWQFLACAPGLDEELLPLLDEAISGTSDS